MFTSITIVNIIYPIQEKKEQANQQKYRAVRAKNEEINSS
jgi:hypothetical protein